MKKVIKRFLILFIIFIITLASVFFIYVSDYYKAEDVAIEVMQDSKRIKVDSNLTILSPTIPSENALIFYPGAKVENTAYLPILQKLTQRGITCILVKMPFNMAIFDVDAANEVFERLPKIKNWYIGGHSMGGAMASKFAAEHKEKVKGVILLGAYIYGDYSPKDTLTIYGSFNSDLEKNINYDENIVIIKGGNHAQFGNYGRQKGDPEATISSEEQQNIAVDAITEFISNR